MEDGRRSALEQIPPCSVYQCEPLRQELVSLKPTALHQRAKDEGAALCLWVQDPVQTLAFSLCKRDYVGVAQQIIEQLIDEELDKRAFIEILIRRILHKELSELKPRALHQRAKDAGAVWWLPRGCIRRRRQVCEQQTSLIPICKALLRISVMRGSRCGPRDDRPAHRRRDGTGCLH
jgi:hypothetical protein